MKTLSHRQVAWRRMVRSPGLWVVMGLLSFVASWMFWLVLDRYVQLQTAFSQMQQLPSVTVHLLLPFFKTVAQMMMLVVAVLLGAAVAREKSQGTWFDVQSQCHRWLWGQWLSAWFVSVLLLVVVLIACWGLAGTSVLQWPLLGLGILAMFLMMAWLKSVALWVSTWSNQASTTTLMALVLFMLWWQLGQNESVAQYGANWLALLSPQKHFDWLISGQLNLASVLFFIGGACLFVFMAHRQANAMKWSGWLVVTQLVWLVLWLVSVVLAARFTESHSYQQSYSDLLPESAKQVLRQQPPLAIEVFATADSVAAEKVNTFLEPVLALVSATDVTHSDPAAHAETMAQLGLSVQGSMRISDGNEQFVMSELSYEQLFNGLKKMQAPSDQWLVLLNGFGSQEFHDESEEGFSEWLLTIKQAGYAVAMMDWKAGLNVPGNVKALIINSPEEPYSEAAIQWLQQQLANGVSLWWLTNPETFLVQDRLSLLFDAMPSASFHAGPLVLEQLPPHPINGSFDRPLDLFHVALFDTGSEVMWQTDQGQAVAAGQDLGEARMLVVGDNDYINNQKLKSGGNLEMSIRQIDWLLRTEDRIDLPTIGLAMSQVQMSPRRVLWLSALMLIIWPGFLMICALRMWHKNR